MVHYYRNTGNGALLQKYWKHEWKESRLYAKQQQQQQIVNGRKQPKYWNYKDKQKNSSNANL